jgi:hypothetical protein
METTEKQPRPGQFTLKGLLGFTMLVAVSLATIRMGIVTESFLPALVGLSLLATAGGIAVGTILDAIP